MIIKEALSSENHERVGSGHETTLRSAQTMPNCCWIQSCTISIPECPRNYGGSRSCKIHSISRISMIVCVSTNRTQLPCASRSLEDTPIPVAEWCSTGGICRPVCTTALFRWTPHPVIVTIRDNKDYIRVLSYSSYTTITGWGVLLTHYGKLWYC